jgi:hypothetical protein
MRDTVLPILEAAEALLKEVDRAHRAASTYAAESVLGNVPRRADQLREALLDHERLGALAAAGGNR